MTVFPLHAHPADPKVTFDATRWRITEPFRALATLVVPGQEDSVIDLSATVCTQKLKLLDGGKVKIWERKDGIGLERVGGAEGMSRVKVGKARYVLQPQRERKGAYVQQECDMVVSTAGREEQADSRGYLQGKSKSKEPARGKGLTRDTVGGRCA